VDKRELSKVDFEMIDDAFKALLQSGHPDPVMKAKIIDLQDKFRDAFTGWLERVWPIRLCLQQCR
jgi:hypothetical protein